MARRRGHGFFIILIVWFFAPVWTKDADDVTTIYRFNNTGYTSRSVYEVPELSDWKISSGFLWTYNTMVDVPFPNEGYVSWSIKANSITDILPISLKETFAITSNTTVFNVYVMSNKDPQLGNIIVVRVAGGKDINILTCNYGEEGKNIFLPGVGKRKCRGTKQEFNSAFASDGDNFTLYFEGYNLKVSGSYYDLLSILPQQFSIMKYVTIASVDNPATFAFRKPARVLALAESSGNITNFYESGRYYSMCLSLFYYMDKNCGGEITLYTGKSNTLVGRLLSSQQKGSWQIHRFVIPPEDQRNIELKIHAKKISNAPLLIHSLRTCYEGDPWDSTSFSTPGSVDIHARTNALGRPFHLQDGRLVDPNVEINIPSCPNRDENCEWVLNNWKRVEKYTKEMDTAPLSLWHEEPRKLIADDSVLSELLPFSGNMNFTFRILNTLNDNSDRQLTIFVSQSTRVVSNPVLAINIQENGLSVLVKWQGYGNHRSLWVPDYNWIDHRVVCSQSYSQVIRFTERSEYRVTTMSVGSRLNVIVEGQSSKRLECNLEGTPLGDETTYYLSLAPRYLNAEAYPAKVNYLLSLERDEGSITSSLILPTTAELCVSLLYYKTGGKLTLGAELLNGSRVQMEEFENTDVWKYTRVVKKLGRQPMRLIIQGWANERSETDQADPLRKIMVQRLAGCHPEEDIVELAQEKNLQVFNPVSVKSGERSLETNSCKNGGLLQDQGNCVCPPGFSGTHCERACGSDRFGNDCNGRCSRSSRECKGMLLCKLSWGCSCAPGYKGFFCSEGCEVDKYGADCQQPCGKCATKDCDSFTGMCPEGCQDGYHPPLCREKCSYFETAPVVQRTVDKISITLSGSVLGNGLPLYYQIQYKEEVYSSWQTIYSAPMKDVMPIGTINIAEPSSKDSYFIRAVIINEDACSYSGDEVPFVELKTNCKIPDPNMYHLATSEIGEHDFTVIWQPPIDNEEWCEVSHYEVFIKEGWKWSLYDTTTSTSLAIKERSPGEQYQVKLQGVMTLGDVTGFSESIVVQTNVISVAAVSNFKVLTSDSTQLLLKWDYPYSAKHFLITYQCVKLLGCLKETCDHSKGHYQSSDTSATLRDLLPLAQYMVKISAFAGTFGPSSALQALTLPAGSKATPAEAEEPIKVRTNTSFTVQWAPPSNCSKLNGFQQGYWYRFRHAGEETTLLDGSTLQTSASFTNLTPHTQYEVDIFVVTNGGWDENYPLTIPVSTRATTPERVANLTVYKRSRREIGLRWAPPVQAYGALQSFTISHTETDLPVKRPTAVISPTPCSAWPDLYCFTIKKLRPGKEYSLSVQARNVEVPEDGDSAFVVTRTQEDAPTAPSFIQMISKDSTSLTIKWGIPWLLNGILRSFLVSVEEVDSYNSSDCCEYFPTREVPVNTEDSSYQIEIAGLRPASTYTISVSAKTVGFGPAVNLTAHSKPPVPTIPSKPNVTIDEFNSDEIMVQLTSIQEFQDLVRSYLLLLVPEEQDEIPQATIWDKGLAEDIKTAINQSFYIVGEYSQEELDGNGVVNMLDLEQYQSIGILSERSDFQLISENSYKVIVVAILEYEGGYNFSFKESDAFIVS